MSQILPNYTTVTVEAEWNDDFPIIPMTCVECFSHFDKHTFFRFRRVRDNIHMINLECMGGCGTWMEQVWKRDEYDINNTNKYTLHSIALKKHGIAIEKEIPPSSLKKRHK